MVLDIIFIILCAISILLLLNKFLFDQVRALKSKTISTSNTWMLLLLDAGYEPMKAFILLIGIYRIVHLLSYDFLIHNIDKIYQIIFLIIVCWFLLRCKNRVELLIQSQKDYLLLNFDPALVMMLSQMVKVIIIFCVVAIVLYIAGIPLQSLMMLQGAVSIALGISAQNVLGNGFGGLMILIYRPFKIGDLISSPDKKIEGYVEEIRWDSTKIINLDRRPLSVPNSMFNQIIIVNSSKMLNRHIMQTINLHYKDIDKIDVITNQIQAMLKLHDGIDQKLAMSAHLIEFGPQSLRIQVNAFTKTAKTSLFYQVQQDICVQIAQIIKNNESEIAVVLNTL